jgi:hypothetical protein
MNQQQSAGFAEHWIRPVQRFDFIATQARI